MQTQTTPIHFRLVFSQSKGNYVEGMVLLLVRSWTVHYHGTFILCLQVLKLAENSLIELPDSISKLRSLADLDVSHNNLQSVPSHIGSLKKLVRLDAAHNELSSLPATIIKCKSLEELNLSHNPIRIKDLPHDLTLRCSNLYNIAVDNGDNDEEEEGT